MRNLVSQIVVGGNADDIEPRWLVLEELQEALLLFEQWIKCAFVKRSERGGRNVEPSPVLVVRERAEGGSVPIHVLFERKDAIPEPARLVVLLNAEKRSGQLVLAVELHQKNVPGEAASLRKSQRRLG